MLPISLICAFACQEALSWDERECELWFYTDGTLTAQTCAVVVLHWKSLATLDSSNSPQGEFHPREAPASNWHFLGAKAGLYVKACAVVT